MTDINPKEMALMLYKLSLETNSLVRAIAFRVANVETQLTEIKYALEAISRHRTLNFDTPEQTKNLDTLRHSFEELIEKTAIACETAFADSLKQFAKNPPESMQSKHEDYYLDLLRHFNQNSTQ